jgi:ribosomal protein L11 methylase PrmA
VLIASGVLREQEVDVVEALAPAGFSVIETKPDGEWVTIAFRQK